MWVHVPWSNDNILTTSVWTPSQVSPSQTSGTCALTATTSMVTMVAGPGVALLMLIPTNILIMSIMNRYNSIYGKKFCTNPGSPFCVAYMREYWHLEVLCISLSLISLHLF